MGKLNIISGILKAGVQDPIWFFRSLKPFAIKRFFYMYRQLGPKEFSQWAQSRLLVGEAQAKKITPSVQSIDDFSAVKLVFPPLTTQPKCTIVIPVFNNIAVTLACLKSIYETTTTIPYEVIVADDQSTDETVNLSHYAENVVHFKQPFNKGFLLNCNSAIAAAKSEFIVLLNNDTYVQPGWLDAMLETFALDNVGLVGPKLIYADGTLQEAGGIIWRDGSGWNYGRGGDAMAPEFNYVKDVDYISGACLMFRKSVWQDVGGFDKHFSPAYYEDTDLAFEVRKRGLRVVYQPKSLVVHLEGVSHGTSELSGVKRYQAINKEKFFAKWSAELSSAHFDNADHVFWARDRSRAQKTIVVIDHYVPTFDQDAGSKAVFLYIKTMVGMGLNVKFIPANFAHSEPYTSALQQLGVEVLYGPFYQKSLCKQWLIDNKDYIHAVFLNRPHIAKEFLPMLNELALPIVYFGHDFHYLRKMREFELSGKAFHEKEAEQWLELESNVMRASAISLFPSSEEVRIIENLVPDVRVRVLPLYALDVNIEHSYEAKNRDGILFVGGFAHPPNIDAVSWFSSDVLPKAREKNFPGVFHVVGSNVPQSIRHLASDSLIVHGFISEQELNDLYQKVRLVVVPLRFGAGVKGKVLEAFCNGVPVLTTPIGAEGIKHNNQACVIQSDAVGFSEELVALYDDVDRLQDLSISGSALIQQEYSVEAVARVFKDAFLV